MSGCKRVVNRAFPKRKPRSIRTAVSWCAPSTPSGWKLSIVGSIPVRFMAHLAGSTAFIVFYGLVLFLDLFSKISLVTRF